MIASYRDLKTILYCLGTICGVAMLLLSCHLFRIADAAPDPASYLISAMVLLVVGLITILFGLDTFLLRDDPDIWR